MTKNQLYYYLTCGMLALIAVLFVIVMSNSTIAAPAPVLSEAQEIEIVTDNEAGKYYAIVKNIEKLTPEQNIDVAVRSSCVLATTDKDC